MKIKKIQDFIAGLMFFVVGAAFAVGASGYSLGTSARPGAGFFPLILSAVLMVLGLLVLFKALTFKAAAALHTQAGIAWRPLGVVVLAIVVFALALPRLGLLLTIPLQVLLVSLASDDSRWRGALLAAVALTAGSWAIFVWGLKLSLPLLPVGWA